MDPANILLLLITINVVSDGAWLPPGLRGDLPPWGPPVPPPWAVPPPSAVFRRPMDAMVDLTNDLGVAILQDNSHSRSNFAFSPYGLASVLVVLYEGAMDESARQIHMAGKFPWDRDITRIGFRDIHRHLRSYFSHEGYLSGITLNKERSSLKGEYKRVLRFYGYDVDVEPPKVPSATTAKPMDQVPLVTKPIEVPSKPTVITSIPTTIGSQVTLNSSSFPGKESVDDVNLTEQTLLFPTTDKPTSQHDKSTLPDMLPEQNKPSTSTILPEVSTVSMATEPTKVDVSPTDASSTPSSLVTEGMVEQAEELSANTNSVPPETTTRNVLDNGMLVPQSSLLDPLSSTASPTLTTTATSASATIATSQMQGTTEPQVSNEPSGEGTSVITESNTEKTTVAADQKTTPEIMTTTFKSVTSKPEEISTTQKSVSSIVTDLIESRIDEEYDQSTTSTQNEKVTTILETKPTTAEMLTTPEGTESKNLVDEIATSTNLDQSTTIVLSSNTEEVTTIKDEKVTTADNTLSSEVTEFIEARNGEKEKSLSTLYQSTTVTMPSSAKDGTADTAAKLETSTVLDEASMNTEGTSPPVPKEEITSTNIDQSTSLPFLYNTKRILADMPPAESTTAVNINPTEVDNLMSNSREEEKSTTILNDLTPTDLPASSRDQPATLLSGDISITTEKPSLEVTDIIESRMSDDKQFVASTKLDQSTPMPSDEGTTEKIDSRGVKGELETKYVSSMEATTEISSSDFKETKEYFGEATTKELPDLLQKTLATTIRESVTEKFLSEARTDSDTTTTHDRLTTVAMSSEESKTEKSESVTKVLDDNKNIVTDESNSADHSTRSTSESSATSATGSTDSKSTEFVSTDQDQTTRRAPVTLSFKPRTKVPSTEKETTDITTDDKELFKRSPEPFEIRTLDEYLLSSDIGNQATPPLRTLVLPLEKHFVPKTLDEYLLLKDSNKKDDEEEFTPKTLDEYFLSLKNTKAIHFKTDLDFKTTKYRRHVRTIADMLHIPTVPDLSLQLQNGMFDSHVSRKAELYRPLPRQPFLVDATSELPVPVMTYTNVFPFAYIPRLHSTAMEFPLDDERYKLLIILPVEKRGLRQLTYDLGIVTLRGVLESLRPSRVRATVPTFMVEGFVILTPALQRLGIWNVFDPRRANLSGMSEDPELYVRNVEQSVTVVIRNYVEILDIQTRTMAARGPEHEFRATHPFLYFVLDTETNVALMAGRMLDPLNSRIY